MIEKLPTFLVHCTPYLEEAALLTFLSSEGFVTVYDGFLLRRSYAFCRHQPENLFAISYAPSPINPEYYFLKGWEVKQTYTLPEERLYLWQGLLGLARCCREAHDQSGLLFRLYQRLLALLSNPEIPDQKVYFSITYILLQTLALIGAGDFVDHYAALWKRLQISQRFHQDFLHQARIEQQDFVQVLNYAHEHLSDVLLTQNLLPFFQKGLQQQATQ